MQFNSALFITCFCLFYGIYHFSATNIRARILLLLGGSLLFYAGLCGWGIFILSFIACSDFFIVRKIFASENEKQKKIWLWLAIIIDLGLLLLMNHLTDWLSLSELKYWPRAVGVSFFVFRSLGYVMDAQREMLDEPEKSFTHYLLYLAYFPLILMGPIHPARDFLPAIKLPFNPQKVNAGMVTFLLVSGIVKKYILSNYLAANFVNRVFDNTHLFTGIENLMASIGQALVVYFDFSGYTDIVCGISMLLGIEIMHNFNFPYISQNITEYWRRWHMSLSKWLNEYLYFPLSFALRGMRKFGTVVAVLITFIISGFWHGTKLHYTFWGLLHGLALSWDILSAPLRDRMKNWVPALVYRLFSVALTFLFLALSGIFFKASTIESGNQMLMHIFTKPGFHFFSDWLQHYPWVFAIIAGTLLLQFVFEMTEKNLIRFFEKLPALALGFILSGTVFLAYQITGMESLPFIYLEF